MDFAGAIVGAGTTVAVFIMMVNFTKKQINYFGMYSGKTIERITYKEAQWADAYDGDNVRGYTDEIIENDAIRDYFKEVSKEFDLKTEEGLRKYIKKQLVC